MKRALAMCAVAAVLLCAVAQADTITHGGTTIDMDFVTISHAGNSADTTGFGAVSNGYRIAQYEVTADQWTSVIAADANVGNAGGYWTGSQPTAGATWYEAAKFCNWLTSGDAYGGAYQFTGDTLTGVDRAAAVATYGTVYVLPTEDEWYKAAYYKADGSGYTFFPTGDTEPDAGITGENWYVSGAAWNVGSGIAENNGTYDMGGNLWEWTESPWDGTLDDMAEKRELRGGHFDDYTSAYMDSAHRVKSDPWNEDDWIIGFRVASIPEPATLGLLGLGGLAMLRRRRQ